MNTDNLTRYYNPTTDQVRYMPSHCARALKGIGFEVQEEPKVLGLEEKKESKPTTKNKKNATN